MVALLPLIYLVLVGTKETGASDHDLPFMEYLDSNHLVCLKWGFNDVEGTIKFRLVVNTTGWVGFGLSPNGGMAGSDIIIGGLGPGGSYFSDRYATGNSMPVVDTQQNYTLLSLNETEGQTAMTFSRTIQSCDDQDFHITAQPIKLIYAYGTTDEIGYHQTRRGTKEVNLLNYMPRTTSPDSKYLSASVEKVAIPTFHTYYHCKVMKFPTLNDKRHIYKVEPEIENLDLVHHMLIYSCPSFVTSPYEKPCFMGDLGEYCLGVVAAWGVGGGVYELPENAGIPIGGEESERFYKLEIHYDNPTNQSGRTDSSGLRLYYTDQLRQFDVGILSTGVLPFGNSNYDIPPRASSFLTYGMCNTSLFSQEIRSVPDLQVFAVLLHTHLAGRKIRVGHFRDGTQIDFLGWDENYNFELQQTFSLGNIKTIKPGDEILVECTYNTANRTRFTKMGAATNDEMCLAFLFYYPAIKISSCFSEPDPTNLSKTSIYLEPEGTKIPSQEEIVEYESLLKNLPQMQHIFGDGGIFKLYPNGTIREMMKTPTISCPSNNKSSKLETIWTLNAAGFLFLLLCIATEN